VSVAGVATPAYAMAADILAENRRGSARLVDNGAQMNAQQEIWKCCE